MRILANYLSQLALAAALIATSQASAQAPNPAAGCAKMKDAVGCACAAVTGGMVSATSWARGQDRHAFEACLAARGASPAATRPATISGRL